ncbi:hypothetical protein DPMN_176715 [Dreissena polymorpha]|uniref:Uncharacterized protein n=1 Tax=Dreissena polymorpha TaxID=45954 RepID=A0A9D4E7E8_DREPO|nr:hypothetical protein DPMN_176715 [Dreissena polymorpha]
MQPLSCRREVLHGCHAFFTKSMNLCLRPLIMTFDPALPCQLHALQSPSRSSWSTNVSKETSHVDLRLSIGSTTMQVASKFYNYLSSLLHVGVLRTEIAPIYRSS